MVYEPPPDWIATWSIKQFHGLPHVNFTLMPVSDVYDLQSIQYKCSLFFLAIIPTIFVILILLPVFAFKLLFPANPTAVDCPCKEGNKKLAYIFYGLCILLMIIVIVCEIIIHSNATHVAQPPLLNGDILIDLEDNAKKYRSDINVTNLNRTLPFPESMVKAPIFWPTKLEIGSYMTEFQKHLANLRLPTLPHKELQSPALDSFYQVEYKHFIIMMIIWLIGLVLAVIYPHHRWQMAVAGLVYACIMSGVMLAICVALSDICIYPGVFFNLDYLQYEFRKNEMNKYAVLLCLAMNEVIDRERPKTKQLLEYYRNSFFRTWRQMETKKNDNYDVRGFIYQSLENDYFKPALEQSPGWKWIEDRPKISCEDQIGKFKQEMIPLEDFTPLCYLVDFMGIQFLALFLLCFVYIYFIIRHTGNLKTFSYYKAVWEERQSQSLKRKPPPCDRSICKGSKVCVCNEQSVRNLTKTELEQIEKQGKMAENLSQEKEAIAQKDKAMSKESVVVALAQTSSSRWLSSPTDTPVGSSRQHRQSDSETSAAFDLLSTSNLSALRKPHKRK